MKAVRHLLPLCLLLSLACESEIGDDCETSTDCSQEGDRLCLTGAEGFPGGYCTVFNCDPDGCPDEAVCVGYRSNLSNVSQCGSSYERRRLERSFCMRACSSDGDCRSGYQCIDVGEAGNPWGATILEEGSEGTRICALQPIVPEDDDPQAGAAGVCENDPEATAALREQLFSSADDASNAGAGEDAGTDVASSGDAGVLFDASSGVVDAATPDDASAVDTPTVDSSSMTAPSDAASSPAVGDAGDDG